MRGFFAPIRMTSKTKDKDKSRSLRDDNQKSKGNCNGDRSCNGKGNGNCSCNGKSKDEGGGVAVDGFVFGEIPSKTHGKDTEQDRDFFNEFTS